MIVGVHLARVCLPGFMVAGDRCDGAFLVGLGLKDEYPMCREVNGSN